MTRQDRYRKRKPWVRYVEYARRRCNPRTTNEKHQKAYVDRGIVCLLTAAELEVVWKRDDAGKLHKPSLDRIDSEGHYHKSNVRFIEHVHNCVLAWKKDEDEAAVISLYQPHT